MFAKKHLGQNFLISPAPIRMMIKECKVSSTDTVLEIGPGKGILTKALLETGAKVIAVEKDTELIPYLSELFAKEISVGQLKLIHADILETDPASFGLINNNYKLIANIPYYITGEIIRKFLETNVSPISIALLVQKEVAERIAKDKKESILSISVKVYGNPKYLGTVKKGLFRPIPNVDSAVILIDNISKSFFDLFDEKSFFEVLRVGFAHKRKKLLSNLKDKFIDKDIQKVFEELNIDNNIRAEELSIDNWKNISTKILTS